MVVMITLWRLWVYERTTQNFGTSPPILRGICLVWEVLILMSIFELHLKL